MGSRSGIPEHDGPSTKECRELGGRCGRPRGGRGRGERTDVARPQAWCQGYCQRPRLLQGSRFVRGPCGGPSSLIGGASQFCFSKSPCLFSSLPGPFPRVTHSRATSSKNAAFPQVPATSAAGAAAAPAPLLWWQVLAGTCIGAGLLTLVFFHHPRPGNFVFWFCHLQKDIATLEKLQRRAAKLIKGHPGCHARIG